MIPVDFFITVPSGTKPGETLYLSGNHAALGFWQLPGVPLRKRPDGCFQARVRLPAGRTIEFKVHRGSWKKAEKGERGEDVPNHRVQIRVGKPVEIEVKNWAGRRKPKESTLTGDIRFHRRFHSEALANDRTLIVYVPPEYEKEPNRRFPVLYMHDGQNIFDAATSFAGAEWQADETAERLIRSQRLEPLIIVGMYNNEDRLSEYSPVVDPIRQVGGKGRQYARFVVEEVKPFIEGQYRTLSGAEHAGIAGSSLGGLISLYICSLYPGQFSRCGAVSPALWWGEAWMLRQMRRKTDWLKNVQLWVDMGTQEGCCPEESAEAIQQSRELVRIFDQNGLLPGRDYYYQEVFEATHSESAWAERFAAILLYFWGIRGQDEHRKRIG